MVERSFKSFIKNMESPKFWRDVRGVEPAATAAVHHSTVKKPKTPTQLDREIAAVTGIGTWKKSDQPLDSEHLDAENVGARVKPGAHYGDYEWSIWVGPPGRRVMSQRGTVKSRASAKRAAQKKFATALRR